MSANNPRWPIRAYDVDVAEGTIRILDIAADGTLAGVELIDNMPDPPHPPEESSNNQPRSSVVTK